MNIMKNKPQILVIIPARGSSKGIPRKNLRALNGKPLIYYSINNALCSKFKPDIYVSSDDDEIIAISEKLGAKIIKRESVDAKDETTLDPVIFKALKHAELIEKKNYDIVITLQPTSPLLKFTSLDSAIERILQTQEIDTIISATDDTHLTWRKENNEYKPNYLKRLNRQQLTPTFKETGGFIVTRTEFVSEESRIGNEVDLFILSNQEAIDIDSYADWSLCEHYLKRKRILFVVSGNNEIGLGHVYNTLLIANDILEHDVIFLVDEKSEMAYQKIASKNYNVFIQKYPDLIDDIKLISPDIVINDKLDTTSDYIKRLKEFGIKVINFEDLGSGAKEADITINAIYPENEVIKNHYFGYKYFLLRDEFILTKSTEVNREVKEVLVSFGGVDPNNLTKKVLQSIYSESIRRNIKINVVTGFGYRQHEELLEFSKVAVHKNVQNISDYMKRSDIIFTSAGRTTYEIASLGIPGIVLAQNDRELTHFFADSTHGFLNLGLGKKLSNDYILKVFLELVDNYEQRKKMSKMMSKFDLRSGRNRVVSLLKQVITS